MSSTPTVKSRSHKRWRFSEDALLQPFLKDNLPVNDETTKEIREKTGRTTTAISSRASYLRSRGVVSITKKGDNNPSLETKEKNLTKLESNSLTIPIKSWEVTSKDGNQLLILKF